METVVESLPYPTTVEKLSSKLVSSSDLSLLKQMARLLKCEVRVLTIDKLRVEQVTVCSETDGLIVSLLHDGDAWCLLQHSKEAEVEKGRKIDTRGFPFRCSADSREIDVTGWDVPTSMLRVPAIMQSPGSISAGQLMSSHQLSAAYSQSALPSIRTSTLQSTLRNPKKPSGVEQMQVSDLKILDLARTTDYTLASVRAKTSRTLEGIEELHSLSDMQIALESISKQVCPT